ncbi:UNVERIFIED_CONTAM: hypothetical protein Scaly_1656900 [Sesamum calycinum]|uniref:Retroviral polymerase SH3-like domain-containing protein n=1 Tax=Sesamum calycinum TaxID=2727403 RepID=A0AAW2NS93_9LAMI
MTKKPFIGESTLAKPLEGLRNTDLKLRTIPIERSKPFEGREYLSGEFIDYLKENGSLSVDSSWNTIVERVILRQRPSLNMAPFKKISQTPYEIWHGKPASYKHLKVWDSRAYVKRLVGDKLDSRSSLFKFIRYPKDTMGYYFNDPFEQKVFISRNAMFLKKGFLLDSRRDGILLQESSEVSHEISETTSVPIVTTDSVPILRRSARVT